MILGVADEEKKCQICGLTPVGPGGMMCPSCRDRIEEQNRTNPYPNLPEV